VRRDPVALAERLPDGRLVIPIPVPDEAKAERGGECDIVDMRPPEGVSDADCGTAQMLLERSSFPGFTGRGQFAYFRPTPDELAVLNAGGYLEMCQIGRVVQPFALNVLPAADGPPHEGDAVDDVLEQGDAGRDTAAVSPRDGADSHDVGPSTSEATPADEKGGAGEPCARPAPGVVTGLRELRVNILRVRVGDDWRPVMVFARVRSSRGRDFYRVQLRDGVWSCTCAAGRRTEACPHALSVSFVTTESAP
jgi:hypothetical protein